MNKTICLNLHWTTNCNSIDGGNLDYISMSGKEIEEELINSVVTNENIEPEEPQEIPEKINEEQTIEGSVPGRIPSLKIFFILSSIKPEELPKKLEESSIFNSRIRQFLSNYQITIIEKEENYRLLKLGWRKYGSDLFFLIKVNEGHWEVLTNEKMEYINRSFLRLVSYSSEVGHLWLERSALEEVVRKNIAEESIKGFIAKRDTLSSKKKVTIRVYGGTKEDLETARDHYESEPTRIYFSRKNSPEDAIVGSIVGYPGYISIDRILPSALPLFMDIKKEIKRKYETSFDSRFVDKNLLHKEYSKNIDDTYAEMSPEYNAIVIRFPTARWKEDEIEDSVKKLFVNGVKTGLTQYIGYKWTGYKNFIIHDAALGGSVQLRIDPQEHSIMLDTLTRGPPKLLGDMTEIIIEKIEHAVTIEAVRGG